MAFSDRELEWFPRFVRRVLVTIGIGRHSLLCRVTRRMIAEQFQSSTTVTHLRIGRPSYDGVVYVGEYARYSPKYGQPIRYLMKYAGETFEEKVYHQKGPPDFDKSEWRDVKDSLALDFPNLPYFIDKKAGVKLSQSKAIMLYLARKHNLVATKEEDIQRQDVVFFESIDLHNSFFFLTYQPSFFEMRDDYVKKDLPPKLKLFQDFLGDRKFFVGDKVNFSDFNVYEALYVHTVLAPDCLKDFPKLKAFMKRFEELKGIKEYMQSKEHIKEPICSRAAFFSAGNEEEEAAEAKK